MVKAGIDECCCDGGQQRGDFIRLLGNGRDSG